MRGWFIEDSELINNWTAFYIESVSCACSYENVNSMFELIYNNLVYLYNLQLFTKCVIK